MTKFTFLWCCPSCKYWWAGVNMNFKHTWHRWLLPLNVKWPLANNSWHSIKESLWQAAFLLYIFVIPEWSYSSGLRWNCSGEQLPETRCSCRSVTKINCMMNVVCEHEYLGESTGTGDGGGQDATGRRCPVVQDSAASASLSSCLSQALVMLNHCTGDFYAACGSFPCPLSYILLPTDQHWHSMDGKRDQWMVLCFLVLAVNLWIFPRTVIWNKTQAALKSIQWHCFFPTKKLQCISRKTDITPHWLYFIILQFQCKPVHTFFYFLDETYPILISFNQNKK